MAPDIDVQLVPLFSERCHCIVPVELVNVIVLLSPKHTDVGDAEAVPPTETALNVTTTSSVVAVHGLLLIVHRNV